MWQLFFHFLLSSAPAVCAEIAGRKFNRVHHIVETVIMKGREIEFLADLFKHSVILVGIGIDVFFQDRIREFGCSFQNLHFSSCDQLLLRVGSGEVQILAAEYQRRAGRSDMNLLRA
jgi:hypothetical protein